VLVLYLTLAAVFGLIAFWAAWQMFLILQKQ